MSIPIEILTAAGIAVVGTMGTDVYRYTRQWIKELIDPRGAQGLNGESDALVRLDTLDAAVTALEPDKRPLMAAGMQGPVVEILASCIDEAKTETLRELTRTLEKRMAELQPTVIQQTVTGNFAGGSINAAGRDNNLGTAR